MVRSARGANGESSNVQGALVKRRKRWLAPTPTSIKSTHDYRAVSDATLDGDLTETLCLVAHGPFFELAWPCALRQYWPSAPSQGSCSRGSEHGEYAASSAYQYHDAVGKNVVEARMVETI